MDEITPLLNSEEVAKYLNVEVITVRRLVKNGKLAAYRIGSEYRFSKDDVETYLQHNYQPARGGFLEKLGIFKSDVPNVQLRRLTQRAKNVLTYAAEETRTLHHATLRCEHLLIALVREQDGMAGKVLEEQGITIESLRTLAQERLGLGREEAPDCLAIDPIVKQLIEQAVAQAKALSHDYIGTEHLLLALLANKDTSDLLKQTKLNAEAAQERIQQLLASI
ncbi:MAG: helix-turn-helix domain-containing protein [Anaerolineaceae bacterium]|nr:helix-turn-helix domain-containing protein [Anaerolineaceae bacterium]